MNIEPGKSRKLTDNPEARIAILSVGPVGVDVATAIKELKNKNISVDHYDMIWVKPLDEDALEEISRRYKGIITVEDGCVTGGFGAAVDQWLEQHDRKMLVTNLGIPDNWVYQGTVSELHADCGYDVNGIVSAVENLENAISADWG